jgi:hypothetical protein
MLVLESSIAQNEWAQEASATRNGVLSGIHGNGAAVPNAGTWTAVVHKLIGFQDVGHDWDGFGAKAPSLDVLKSAISLAYLLSDKGMEPPSGVMHSADGTVVFEWQTSDGVYAEMEIDRPLHAEVMLIEPGKPAKHWVLPTE